MNSYQQIAGRDGSADRSSAVPSPILACARVLGRGWMKRGTV
jgi:hypothetical protein